MTDASTNPQFNPETTKVDLSHFVDTLGEPSFKFGELTRRPFEKLARKCMIFWGGNQWVDIVDDNSRIFDRREVYPDVCEEVRRTNNQIPIYTRQIVSAMSDNMSDLEGIPATYSPEDVEAAQLATRTLKWRHREDKEDEKRELELMWLFGSGEVLRRTYWDTEAGRKGYNEGDIATEVVSFFRYVKDPHSVDVWPPRWLIEYDARNVDWIKQAYGVQIEPEDVADAMRNLDELALNVMTGKRGSREPDRSSAVLKRMYVPPGERYPDGHCWVWAAGKLLKHHDLQCSQFPFSVARWFPIPGRLYPISLIEMLLADQRHLNVLLSQIQELSNRQLRGDIITSGIDQEATQKVINARTGQKQIMLPAGCDKWDFLRYDQNWQLGQMLYDWVITDMHQKAGQNKPILGQDVGREVRVGELQIAREADFESLAWHGRQYERHTCEIARQKLVLAHDLYNNLRMMTLFGDKDAPTHFFGAELRDTRDVIAIPTPHLTPAMKRQAQAQARVDGLMPPYVNKTFELSARVMLRFMGLGDLEDEIAQVYGPLEDVQLHCQKMSEIQFETELLQAEAIRIQIRSQLEVAANPPQVVPQPGEIGAPAVAVA